MRQRCGGTISCGLRSEYICLAYAERWHGIIQYIDREVSGNYGVASHMSARSCCNICWLMESGNENAVRLHKHAASKDFYVIDLSQQTFLAHFSVHSVQPGDRGCQNKRTPHKTPINSLQLLKIPNSISYVPNLASFSSI